MLAGVLGQVPLKDVLSAILAAVLGVYMNSRRSPSRDVNRWDEDWDLS